MATVLHDRIERLQNKGTRLLPVQLPSDFTTTGDHQGTWNTLGQTVHRNDQVQLSSTGALLNGGGGALSSLNNVGGNFTGLWDNVNRTAHRNDQVQLSNTGSLLNAGGGSLTSLNNVSGNFTGLWDSASRTVHRNDQITLSSTGTLNNAGGGSITNLNYSNVGGTKPPSNATSNFFSTSGSNPSGGSDGDAHWNSSTSTMWFRTGGVWRVGGTINASQITVGTLAAARIASNSVTTDKLNVSTLSGITSSMGTLTNGTISSSSVIDINGFARFNGSIGGYAIQANSSAGGVGGVTARSTAGSLPAVRGENTVGGLSMDAVCNTGGGTALRCLNQAGGTAININGPMVISSQTVSNLTSGSTNHISGGNVSGTVASATNASNATNATNASNSNSLGGVDDSGWCRGVACDVGTATASAFGFGFISVVSGVETAATGGNNYRVRSTSDRRKKTDILPEELGLDFIKQLIPVTYRWKKDTKIKHHGLIAQDVEPLINNPNDALAITHEDGVKGVDYISMVGVLIKGMQELNGIIESQQDMINQLKRKIEDA